MFFNHHRFVDAFDFLNANANSNVRRNKSLGKLADKGRLLETKERKKDDGSRRLPELASSMALVKYY